MSRSTGQDGHLSDSTPPKTPDSARSLPMTARYDQAAFQWDPADIAELRSITSCSDSDLDDYLSDVLDPLNFRTFAGSSRVFSASNETYLLPIDEEEIRRLDKQHILLRLGQPFDLQRALRSILADGENKTALDVGCGSGQWAIELASDNPKIQVIAIDEAAQTYNDVPTNVEFRRYNVNDGLAPFYNGYDVVHVRCIGSGIRSYRNLLIEATNCLRPGGLAIFIEGDFDLLDKDQVTILEPASDNNEAGSWMQRWMQAVRQAQVRRCNVADVDDSPETLDKGLWQFEEYHEQSCGTGSIFTPVSPWPTSSLKEESLHYKMFVLATKQLLIEDGVTPEQVEEWAPKAIAELDDDARYHTWFRWRIAWGRLKPLTSNSPASTSSITQENGQNHVKPNMVPKKQHMAAQAALREKVRHFKIPHCHVRNREQSLAYIKERTNCSFSTRGQF
ncbi:hypothetical protein PIIN_00409 [Serendipita indica DSM 11827]|uniref:Uncharacterized protein n=1 Tax=Serendipita indica (strain DSM 11827) TaxID=1109443 RepID=G4T609_SERID|nr:hypothetical protein PIIN_00409 [Serendipita indica DSM 11827]